MADATPAEELRAAATLLRETAVAVPYGPPWAVADDVPQLVVSGDLRPWGAPSVADTDDPRIAGWIALMGPDKAELLAAWLDDEADRFEAEGGTTCHDGDATALGCGERYDAPEHRCVCFDKPLAFARSINGGFDAG